MTPRFQPAGLIGVVHLQPLPGDPRSDGNDFRSLAEAALVDARALVAGGVDAVIVENFGSAPFHKGVGRDRVPPAQAAGLAIVCDRIRREVSVPIGVNCLRNDALTALGIAATADLDFVRINVHVGAMLTDQGLIEGEAHRTLRYRRELGIERVALLCDVLVKHAQPLAPPDVETITRDTLDRGLADAVIVTGAATGDAPPLERIERVRAAAGARPVLLGSGLTPDGAAAIGPLCDGAIVGTWVKQDGCVDRPVDVERVRALRAALTFRDAHPAP